LFLGVASIKNVLLVGSGSGIGKAFMAQARGTLKVTAIRGSDGTWAKTDFRGFDAVVHCAGLVHQRQTKKNRILYDILNRELAVLIAKKAKEAGVGQFVFLSTMSVYGRQKGLVTRETQPAPREGDAYGLSKWQAEQQLAELCDETFGLTVLRPPMVYGPGCRGNFPKLVLLASLLPVFPRVRNRRSMIFSETLGALIRELILRGQTGTFCPQNSEYVQTSDMVKQIARAMGKKIWVTRLLAPLAYVLSWVSPSVRKLFGSYAYAQELSQEIGFDYQTLDFAASVQKSVTGKRRFRAKG